MGKAAFFTDLKKNEKPILIVDKLGIIGDELAKNISQESLVIFVSGKQTNQANTIHVPFSKKIPTIPDNKYSHIILIDEYHDISNHLLQSFVKKATIDNSKITLVIKDKDASPKFIEKNIKPFEKLKILLMGDIFGKDFIYDGKTFVNKFIKEIRESKTITIPGEGLEETIPVFLENVVTGILQATFVDNNEAGVFFLFPKQKITLLALAKAFQKENSEIQIRFVKTKKRPSPTNDKYIKGKYLLGEGSDALEDIKKIDFALDDIKEIFRDEKKTISIDSLSGKGTYVFLGLALTVVFFFVIPFLSTLFFEGAGSFVLSGLKNEINMGNFTNIKNSALTANTFFKFSKASYNLLYKQAEFAGVEKNIAKLGIGVDRGEAISRNAYLVFNDMLEIKSKILLGKGFGKEEFNRYVQDFKNGLIIYQKEKELGSIPSEIDKKLTKVVKFVSATIDVWPEILGFNSQKNYLILFQDNTELRPGGGLITAYATVTIDKGRITKYKIESSNLGKLDNEIRIEPPFPIRRYLPSRNLSFRDSNFDVEYSKNALAASVFINNETKKPIDGVIALDLSALKYLLEATGDIDVNGFSDRLGSDNIFENVISYSILDSKNNTSEKEKYILAIFSSFFQKISKENSINYLMLLEKAAIAIEEKHVLFAFNTVDAEATFSINGWGGTIVDYGKLSDNNISDVLAISEANLGNNSVNYKVERSLSQNVVIGTNGSVNEILNLNIKNNTKKTPEKNSTYKNYIRLVFPENTKIEEIEVNGIRQDLVEAVSDPTKYEKSDFVVPKGLETEEETKDGKTTLGFFITVEPGGLKSINVSYRLAKNLNIGKNKFSYNMKLFKQPGTESIEYDFKLQQFENIKPISLSEGLKKEDNKVIFNKNIYQDEAFFIDFARE